MGHSRSRRLDLPKGSSSCKERDPHAHSFLRQLEKDVGLKSLHNTVKTKYSEISEEAGMQAFGLLKDSSLVSGMWKAML